MTVEKCLQRQLIIEKDLKLDISYSSKSITFKTFPSFNYGIFGDHFTPFTATVKKYCFKVTRCFQYTISKHLATNLSSKIFQDDDNYILMRFKNRRVCLLSEED